VGQGGGRVEAGWKVGGSLCCDSRTWGYVRQVGNEAARGYKATVRTKARQEEKCALAGGWWYHGAAQRKGVQPPLWYAQEPTRRTKRNGSGEPQTNATSRVLQAIQSREATGQARQTNSLNQEANVPYASVVNASQIMV